MKPPIPQPPPTGFDFASRFPNASKSAVTLNGSTTDNRKLPSLILHPMPPNPTKNRIRQNSAGLNKTEQAWLNEISLRWPNFQILSQAVTLKLGNGVRYTPDFMVKFGIHGELFAWEVKGFLRDDANVKLKVAASLYPWIKFHLVTRKKGEWIIQEILP